MVHTLMHVLGLSFVNKWKLVSFDLVNVCCSMVDFEYSQVISPQYNCIDKFEMWDYMLWRFKIENLLKARSYGMLLMGMNKSQLK